MPGNSKKMSTSASLTVLKPLTMWITTNCRKFLKRQENQTTFPVSWETCMQNKKQWLELNKEPWTGSKLGKEYVKVVYYHPAYLMKSKSCEKPGWISSWNQDCWEKYQQSQICRWYHSYGRKWRGTKEPLDKGEREWKSCLKTQHSKNGYQHLVLSLHGK